MDEISQHPRLDFRFPGGRWFDGALAVALIAAAAIAVMTGGGSRPAAAPAGRPSAEAAPALLPSTVRPRIPQPSGQPGGMTILGSTAWISDWPASRIVGVDLPARRISRTLQVGDQQNQPVSMTSGAGSLWVLDFSGPLLRINPASGTVIRRFPSRDVVVKAAPVPGAGLACAASPGPHGIWIGCAGVDRITLINEDSLKPAQSLPVDSGGYIPQIVSGRD